MYIYIYYKLTALHLASSEWTNYFFKRSVLHFVLEFSMYIYISTYMIVSNSAIIIIIILFF